MSDILRYPQNWKEIMRVKGEEAGWVCPECGKQCRKPGEKFDNFSRTLTVIHLNHDPEDFTPGNLSAACVPCRLCYDEEYRRQAQKKRRSKKVVPFKKTLPKD